jgi:hypothetical protein
MKLVQGALPEVGGGEILGIAEAKGKPKRKKLRTKINGKFKDVCSADKNIQNATVEPLFIKYKGTVHLFIHGRLRRFACFVTH